MTTEIILRMLWKTASSASARRPISPEWSKSSRKTCGRSRCLLKGRGHLLFYILRILRPASKSRSHQPRERRAAMNRTRQYRNYGESSTKYITRIRVCIFRRSIGISRTWITCKRIKVTIRRSLVILELKNTRARERRRTMTRMHPKRTISSLLSWETRCSPQMRRPSKLWIRQSPRHRWTFWARLNAKVSRDSNGTRSGKQLWRTQTTRERKWRKSWNRGSKTD